MTRPSIRKHFTPVSLALVSLALAGAAALSPALAAEPAPNANVVFSEALTGKVTLPETPSSSLVMAPCFGCAPKSFATTARTEYFLRNTSVTLQELKTAIGSQQNLIIIVAYDSVKNELVNIRASLDAPAPAARAKR